jgi:hypothetical protein
LKGIHKVNTNVIPLDVARFDPDEPVSLNDLPGVETYTVLEVAARLGIGRCMAYDLVRQGVIPARSFIQKPSEMRK